MTAVSGFGWTSKPASRLPPHAARHLEGRLPPPGPPPAARRPPPAARRQP
jgi:hypothetical protein